MKPTSNQPNKPIRTYSVREIRPLISEKEIETRLNILAADLATYYAGKPLTLVAVLEGSFIFAADLVRKLPQSLDIQFLTIRASSYLDDLVTSGKVRLEKEQRLPLEERHVLIVDDILDTGLTLQKLKETCQVQKPAELKTCVLLRKRRPQKPHCEADWIGFEIEDLFVVGYGLDVAGHFRHLPHIGYIQA